VGSLAVLLLTGLVGWQFVQALWKRDSETIRRSSAKPSAPTDSGGRASDRSDRPPQPPVADLVELNIAYGTEKKNWLEGALREYRSTALGQRSKINLVPAGSLEGAKLVLDGPDPKPIHVWSPASSAYRGLFEQQWKVKRNRPPILEHKDLALTPMVFVMWKQRHDEFLKKFKVVNFRMIGEAMAEPKGWTTISDKSDWGLFKFSHTHPSKSNSGFLTLILMAYEFRDKLRDLSVDEVTGSDFRVWLAEFERRVTRPSGTLTASTGTLMQEMVNKGPSQYDCLLLYENLAIEYMDAARSRWGEQGELFVIYPDPNIWNDHPFYILDVPWSSASQRAAAHDFVEFLVSEPIQRKALDYGFRPGNSFVPVSLAESPLVKYKASGLKVNIPRICEPPRSAVVTSLLAEFEHLDR
jgi:hypothetical protein